MAWQTFGDNAQHLEHISVRACQGESKREKEEGEVVEKPSVNVNYKKNMGGVDTADQYMATYCFLWRTLKWWQKLFFWGMKVSIINIYILYVVGCKKKKLRSNEPYQVQVTADNGPCWGFPAGWWCIHKGARFHICPGAETEWEASCNYSTYRGKTQRLHIVLQKECARW